MTEENSTKTARPIIPAFVVIGILAIVIVWAVAYSKTRPEKHDDCESKMRELGDENEQLDRERRDLEDKLRHRRECVEGASSLEEARGCF